MAAHSTKTATLAHLPSGTPIRTTVHTYDSDTPGPTLYVQATQHGREVNGAEVLRRLHSHLLDADLSGRVIAVPVANPITFDRSSYTAPDVLDSVNPNMNRVWPGDPAGSLHERMAATLWSHAAGADAVVDLHTGSPDTLPHVVFMRGHEPSRRLAAAFGTDLLLAEPAGDEAAAEWHDRSFGGKLRVAAVRAGVPAITPEIAHNRRLVESAVETGVAGLLDVLRELGVLDGSPTRGDPTLARNHLGRVTADASGLFRPDPALGLGDDVAAGERVGTVYDPASFDARQVVETDRAGVVYGVTREATVVEGDCLVRVALRLAGE